MRSGAGGWSTAAPVAMTGGTLAQDEARVAVFRRLDGRLAPAETVEGRASLVIFPAVGITLSLAEIDPEPPASEDS